jgi:hypothetical protein
MVCNKSYDNGLTVTKYTQCNRVLLPHVSTLLGHLPSGIKSDFSTLRGIH